ncbi:hypothetical protein REPUB_Repub12eG0089400 [Reevesia pubescens]
MVLGSPLLGPINSDHENYGSTLKLGGKELGLIAFEDEVVAQNHCTYSSNPDTFIRSTNSKIAEIDIKRPMYLILALHFEEMSRSFIIAFDGVVHSIPKEDCEEKIKESEKV